MSTNNPFAPHETEENGQNGEHGRHPEDGVIDLGPPQEPHPIEEAAKEPLFGADLHEPAFMPPAAEAANDPVPRADSPSEAPAADMFSEPVSLEPVAAGSPIEDAAAAPPPDALPVDPAWLAKFVASLASAGELLGQLKQDWQARPAGTVEDPALASAVTALDQQQAELLEQLRGYELAPAEESAAPAAESKPFGFDEGPASSAPTVAPSTKRRPGGGGGDMAMVWMMVQVILGGLLAAPAAQLILWWLPFGLARDPFHLAGQLPPWAAFLAPASLRGDSETANNNPPPVKPNKPGKKPAGKKPGDMQPENFPDPLNNRPLPMPMDELPELPDPGLPLVGPPIPPAPVAPAVPGIGPRGAPVVTSPDFAKAIDLLDLRAQAYEKADDAGRGKMIKDFYTACADVAKAYTFVDPEGAMVPERNGRAKGIVSSFHAIPGLADRLGRVGAFWLRAERQNLDGVLLSGTVEEIRPAGKFFETRIALRDTLTKKEGDGFTDKPQVVSVLSISDPKGKYEVGAEVFVLGVVVVNPKDNLVGYEGDEPYTIWRGTVIDLSPM